MPLDVNHSKSHKTIFVECGKCTDTPPFRVTCEASDEEFILDRHEVKVLVRACGLTSQNFSMLQDLHKRIQGGRSHSLIGTSLTSSQQLEGPVRLSVGQDVAGVIVAIGSEVSTLSVGDEVAGIIPLDSSQSGCSEYVIFQEFDLIKKPKKVSFVDAAGCIGDAVKAYTALCFLARMKTGNSVLVLNGASSFGSMCVQLAHLWGAKVLSTATSRDEVLYLKSLGSNKVQVLEMGEGDPLSLRAACMHETGGLGVDVLVESDSLASCHSKHELISCLAVGGCWVTTRPNLQIDPPNSRQLYMRCASLAYLFEQAWLLSSVQQGRHQHVLKDIMEKLFSDAIRPNIHHTVSFDEVADAVLGLEEVKVGKVVMMV
ncbi:quinone oxidoreductase-like protein 1 isoform X1 [Ischnura elegans]|uniref:quinone oxidoreductase-like protein 1 isoform X1 n=2 Tax=Ischnura elegans TaxID=197161 RepID=UPI001ED8BD61|nr:quinone oxidoreductase-like protein 1 isoform X1 [Ischnura elegans]